LDVLRDSIESGRMPSGQPLKQEAAALHERGAALGSPLASWALVQTFGINATKRSGTLRGSCGENSIPHFWRPGFILNLCCGLD
jgi:hypothetical protein